MPKQIDPGQDVFRAELRDFEPLGVEAQIFQNGVLPQRSAASSKMPACSWTPSPIWFTRSM